MSMEMPQKAEPPIDRWARYTTEELELKLKQNNDEINHRISDPTWDTTLRYPGGLSALEDGRDEIAAEIKRRTVENKNKI